MYFQFQKTQQNYGICFETTGKKVSQRCKRIEEFLQLDYKSRRRIQFVGQNYEILIIYDIFPLKFIE